MTGGVGASPTFGQVTADFQFLSKEHGRFKRSSAVECFKQNHPQLPHCGGTGPVRITTVPLRRNVSRGA